MKNGTIHDVDLNLLDIDQQVLLSLFALEQMPMKNHCQTTHLMI